MPAPQPKGMSATPDVGHEGLSAVRIPSKRFEKNSRRNFRPCRSNFSTQKRQKIPSGSLFLYFSSEIRPPINARLLAIRNFFPGKKRLRGKKCLKALKSFWGTHVSRSGHGECMGQPRAIAWSWHSSKTFNGDWIHPRRLGELLWPLRWLSTRIVGRSRLKGT